MPAGGFSMSIQTNLPPWRYRYLTKLKHKSAGISFALDTGTVFPHYNLSCLLVEHLPRLSHDINSWPWTRTHLCMELQSDTHEAVCGLWSTECLMRGIIQYSKRISYILQISQGHQIFLSFKWSIWFIIWSSKDLILRQYSAVSPVQLVHSRFPSYKCCTFWTHWFSVAERCHFFLFNQPVAC